jgi:hypothetical protein
MSLVSKYGAGADLSAPAELEPAPIVAELEHVVAPAEIDNSETARAGRRAMFADLGWSTGSAPVVPAPAELEHELAHPAACHCTRCMPDDAQRRALGPCSCAVCEAGRISSEERTRELVAPAEIAPAELVHCAGCSWQYRPAADCPGRGGFACSDRDAIAKRETLEPAHELETVSAEIAPAPAELVMSGEELRADHTGRRPGDPPVIDTGALPAGALEHPRNAVTGAQYGGRNIEKLRQAAYQAGYGRGGWAGFQQWLTVGRVVRKGEHGTSCLTVMGDRKKAGDASSSTSAKTSTDSSSSTARKGRGVRGFRVFHFDQTCELESAPAPTGGAITAGEIDDMREGGAQ